MCVITREGMAAEVQAALERVERPPLCRPVRIVFSGNFGDLFFDERADGRAPAGGNDFGLLDGGRR